MIIRILLPSSLFKIFPRSISRHNRVAIGKGIVEFYLKVSRVQRNVYTYMANRQHFIYRTFLRVDPKRDENVFFSFLSYYSQERSELAETINKMGKLWMPRQHFLIIFQLRRSEVYVSAENSIAFSLAASRRRRYHQTKISRCRGKDFNKTSVTLINVTDFHRITVRFILSIKFNCFALC